MLKRSLLLAMLVLFCMWGAAAQESYTLSRQVLLPDGTPAVGATVTVRSYTGIKLLHEEQLTTNANGEFTAQMIMAEMATRSQALGCVVIEAPGCAITFLPVSFGRVFPPSPGSIQGPGGPPPLTPATGVIKLPAAYTRSGTVIDKATGKPVAGAAVAIRHISSGTFGGPMLPINIPPMRIFVRALTTTSDANGMFTLPGIAQDTGDRGVVTTVPFIGKDTANRGAVTNGMSTLPVIGQDTASRGVMTNCQPYLYALGKSTDGKILLGANPHFNFSNQTMTAQRPELTQIALSPTVSVTGRVLDAVTHQPVAGVQVRVQGDDREQDLFGVIGMAVTDTEGQYTFPIVPMGRLGFVMAMDPAYGFAWAKYHEAAPSFGRPVVQTPPETPITAPDLIIPPLVTLSGKVVDEVTQRPVGTPFSISAFYTEGYRDNNFRLEINPISCITDAHGAFTMRAPVGSYRFSCRASGYSTSTVLDVPAEGKTGVVLTAERSDGQLFRLVTTNPQGFKAVRFDLRNPTTDQKSWGGFDDITPDGYWFFRSSQGKPEGWEVQILRNGVVIVPWMPINTQAWPQIITIP